MKKMHHGRSHAYPMSADTRLGLWCSVSMRRAQIQALDRTSPILPMGRAAGEGHPNDYRRYGMTTLFAALEVATGKVTDACFDRHGKFEFLDLPIRTLCPQTAQPSTPPQADQTI